MKRIHPTSVGFEPWEEQRDAGRVNPALQVVIGKNKYKLESGTSDYNYYWRDGKYLYVLSMNSRFPYVGLDQYDYHTKHQEKVILPNQSVFLQGGRIQEFFGDTRQDALNYSPAYIMKVLMQAIY